MSRSGALALCLQVRTDEVVADPLGLDAPEPEQPPSRPLSCVSRRAVGFDSSMSPQNVVNALHIEAHLAHAPAFSYLKIQGGGGVGRIRTLAVDNNMILLASRLSPSPRTSIYIIYNAVKRSIFMIPSHPWSQPCKPLSKDWGQRPTALVSSILIARRSGDEDDGSYALASVAEMPKYSNKHDPVRSQDALYLWRSSSPSPKWDLVKASFPRAFKGDSVAHSYTAVLAFSFCGRAFWANLARGIMYCSCDALLPAPGSRSPKLEFHFIELPVQHPPRLPPNVLCAMELHSNMFRTVGRVGETSIKFVTIDGFMELQPFEDCTVTVWSLSQDLATWTKSFSLCLDILPHQLAFKNGGLSTDMVPMYPRLSTEEDDTIYVMLGNYAACCLKHVGSKDKCKDYVAVAEKPLHLLRLDMRLGILLDCVPLPDQVGHDFTFCDLSRYLCGTSHDS